MKEKIFYITLLMLLGGKCFPNSSVEEKCFDWLRDAEIHPF